MKKIREIIRLKHENPSLSINQIHKSTGSSRSAISEILSKFNKSNVSFESLNTLNDDELELLIYPNPKTPKCTRPEPDCDYIDKELRKAGVTLTLLWYEYKQAHPDGLQYTQFCERYRDYCGKRKISNHVELKAGEKMFVDWAGNPMQIVDCNTGEIHEVPLFITTIGTSGYPYVEAFPSKEKQYWIKGHIHAFEYYQGVPLILVPDNDKSAVTKANNYDPVLNSTYREMAEYYGPVIIPARIRTPKDKGQVESAVGWIETWIVARLRNEKFFSLTELNATIKSLLKEMVKQPFQKRNGSRESIFLELDKPLLKPLPKERYSYGEWMQAKVNIDYHIQVDKQYYSVPYTYVKEKVDVRVTDDTVTIYHKGIRLCIHQRSYGKHFQFKTVKEHMPPNHRAYVTASKEGFIKWAQKIGNETEKLVENLFNQRQIEEQVYRQCMGIKRLVKDYGNERVEIACQLANSIQSSTLKYVTKILKNNIDLSNNEEEKVIVHKNIRGSSYYKKTEGDYLV